MVAIAVAAAVVGWLILGSRPGAKALGPTAAGRGKAGRTFIDAMHEVQKQAAALKIEEIFGQHPSNPFLAPFASMKAEKPESDPPKS